MQVFVFANSHKDKLIVHDNAMPLLSQLYEQVLAECEEDECCWYGATALFCVARRAEHSSRRLGPL